jgi:hypothetical protein
LTRRSRWRQPTRRGRTRWSGYQSASSSQPLLGRFGGFLSQLSWLVITGGHLCQ